jgi:hypothetical protein
LHHRDAVADFIIRRCGMIVEAVLVGHAGGCHAGIAAGTRFAAC